jgi:hypothetical protein
MQQISEGTQGTTVFFVSNRLADCVLPVVGSSRSVVTSPNSVRYFRLNL